MWECRYECIYIYSVTREHQEIQGYRLYKPSIYKIKGGET